MNLDGLVWICMNLYELVIMYELVCGLAIMYEFLCELALGIMLNYIVCCSDCVVSFGLDISVYIYCV